MVNQHGHHCVVFPCTAPHLCPFPIGYLPLCLVSPSLFGVFLIVMTFPLPGLHAPWPLVLNGSVHCDLKEICVLFLSGHTGGCCFISSCPWKTFSTKTQRFTFQGRTSYAALLEKNFWLIELTKKKKKLWLSLCWGWKCFFETKGYIDHISLVSSDSILVKKICHTNWSNAMGVRV